MREAFGGEYKNCIFGDYNGYGLTVENKYSPDDAKDRMDAGELVKQAKGFCHALRLRTLPRTGRP